MKFLRKLIAAATVVVAVAAPGLASAATFILPTPENSTATYGIYKDASGAYREAILMDGIPIAFKYDDFWSYSAKILDSIQTVNPTLIPTATFGNYDFSTGTGTIVVKLTSVAGGATSGFGLQYPVDLTGPGDNVTGWVGEWGNDPQSLDVWAMSGQQTTPTLSNKSYSETMLPKEGSTSTVGELLTALQSMNPDWTIPLIYADYNQTGAGDSLFMSAQVRIIDPDTGEVKGFWQLDSSGGSYDPITNTWTYNNVWDQDLPTYNFGDITFQGDPLLCDGLAPDLVTPLLSELWNPLTGKGCAGVTTSGSTYTGSHNLGSGKADFMAYAPDMDLTKFDSDWLWVATVNLGCNPEGLNRGLTGELGVGQGCNTNGFEEFGIIGGIGGNRLIPEPGSLLLLSLGLLAAGYTTRRKSIK